MTNPPTKLKLSAFGVMPLGDFMRQLKIQRCYELGGFIEQLIQFSNARMMQEKNVAALKALQPTPPELQGDREPFPPAEMLISRPTITDELEQVRSLLDKAREVATAAELKQTLKLIVHARKALNADTEWLEAKTLFRCLHVAVRGELNEKGLRALARERKITVIKGKPLEWNEWGSIIKAIEDRANQLAVQLKMGPQRDRVMEFYRGAAGEMAGFKDTYRNYVTHDRAAYDQDAALTAYHRVGEFMQRLAVRLSETQKGPIKWPKK